MTEGFLEYSHKSISAGTLALMQLSDFNVDDIASICTCLLT